MELEFWFVSYGVAVDARHWVSPGADRPRVAAGVLAVYIPPPKV